MNKSEIYNKEFLPSIIKWGRLTNLLAVVGSLSPAIYLMVVYGAQPPIAAVLSATVYVMIGMTIVDWIVEPITYFPILGIPGTYMSFLAGNISNMRMPCSALAQEAAGVEEGTDEGSVLSTLGVGTSIFINVLFMTIGTIIGAQLVAMFPPILKAAISYILPTIFGGVFGQFAVKDIRMGAIAFAVGSIVKLTGVVPDSFILPVCVVVAVFAGLQLKKYDDKKNAGSAVK